MIPELKEILDDTPQPFNSTWTKADYEEHAGRSVTNDEWNNLVSELEDAVLRTIEDHK